MKKRLLTTTALTVIAAGIAFAAGGRITLASRPAGPAAAKPVVGLTAGRSELPTEATAAFF